VSATADQCLAADATFTFMRLISRHFLNCVFESTPEWLEAAPMAFIRGLSHFECLIFECLSVVHSIVTFSSRRQFWRFNATSTVEINTGKID
jgi:hypothetical protein